MPKSLREFQLRRLRDANNSPSPILKRALLFGILNEFMKDYILLVATLVGNSQNNN